MRNMLRAGALALALLPGVAFGQSSVLPYYYNAGGVKTPVGSSNPLPVSASVSASISGFPTVQTTGTPISVTTGGVTGTLPAGAVVVASNVGTTNAAYCKLGASASTSDQYIAPSGGWFAFTVGANTQLTCITSTSTTTVNMVGGSGLPTGTGGGSGGGGGGGAITMASGAVASGAYSSGSIASGAFASGSIGSGAFASGSIGSGAVASGAVASGAYASGSIASGAMVDLGSQADAACGTDNGTCSAIALIKRGNQTATTTATAVQAAVPAGEAHIGEIGSNQIKVQVAQTVTASAYSAGNALGGLMTVANAARVSGSAGAAGTGGILTGLQLNSKTIQSGVQVDVFIFDANPTGSTCTDKTAFVIAAADFDKVVGILTIPSTPANGAGWFGATTTGAVGIPSYFPVTYDLASSTSIYACAVVRAAITPAATTDISFKYNILRN